MGKRRWKRVSKQVETLSIPTEWVEFRLRTLPSGSVSLSVVRRHAERYDETEDAERYLEDFDVAPYAAKGDVVRAIEAWAKNLLPAKRDRERAQARRERIEAAAARKRRAQRDLEIKEALAQPARHLSTVVMEKLRGDTITLDEPKHHGGLHAVCGSPRHCLDFSIRDLEHLVRSQAAAPSAIDCAFCRGAWDGAMEYRASTMPRFDRPKL